MKKILCLSFVLLPLFLFAQKKKTNNNSDAQTHEIKVTKDDPEENVNNARISFSPWMFDFAPYDVNLSASLDAAKVFNNKHEVEAGASYSYYSFGPGRSDDEKTVANDYIHPFTAHVDYTYYYSESNKKKDVRVIVDRDISKHIAYYTLTPIHVYKLNGVRIGFETYTTNINGFTSSLHYTSPTTKSDTTLTNESYHTGLSTQMISIGIIQHVFTNAIVDVKNYGSPVSYEANGTFYFDLLFAVGHSFDDITLNSNNISWTTALNDKTSFQSWGARVGYSLMPQNKFGGGQAMELGLRPGFGENIMEHFYILYKTSFAWPIKEKK